MHYPGGRAKFRLHQQLHAQDQPLRQDNGNLSLNLCFNSYP